jgi:hypothetical protein
MLYSLLKLKSVFKTKMYLLHAVIICLLCSLQTGCLFYDTLNFKQHPRCGDAISENKITKVNFLSKTKNLNEGNKNYEGILNITLDDSKMYSLYFEDTTALHTFFFKNKQYASTTNLALLLFKENTFELSKDYNNPKTFNYVLGNGHLITENDERWIQFHQNKIVENSINIDSIPLFVKKYNHQVLQKILSVGLSPVYLLGDVIALGVTSVNIVGYFASRPLVALADILLPPSANEPGLLNSWTSNSVILGSKTYDFFHKLQREVQKCPN